MLDMLTQVWGKENPLVSMNNIIPVVWYCACAGENVSLKVIPLLIQSNSCNFKDVKEGQKVTVILKFVSIIFSE